MLHEPAADSGPDPAAAYKTRLGVVMFLIYCVVYAGFVLLNVLTEGKAMQAIGFAGLNIAVIYGMALIIFALILALLYSAMCTAKEKALADSQQQSSPRSQTGPEPVGDGSAAQEEQA